MHVEDPSWQFTGWGFTEILLLPSGITWGQCRGENTVEVRRRGTWCVLLLLWRWKTVKNRTSLVEDVFCFRFYKSSCLTKRCKTMTEEDFVYLETSLCPLKNTTGLQQLCKFDPKVAGFATKFIINSDSAWFKLYKGDTKSGNASHPLFSLFRCVFFPLKFRWVQIWFPTTKSLSVIITDRCAAFQKISKTEPGHIVHKAPEDGYVTHQWPNKKVLYETFYSTCLQICDIGI